MFQIIYTPFHSDVLVRLFDDKYSRKFTSQVCPLGYFCLSWFQINMMKTPACMKSEVFDFKAKGKL